MGFLKTLHVKSVNTFVTGLTISEEMEPKGHPLHRHWFTRGDWLWELAHTIVEAKDSHQLLPVSCWTRKASGDSVHFRSPETQGKSWGKSQRSKGLRSRNFKVQGLQKKDAPAQEVGKMGCGVAHWYSVCLAHVIPWVQFPARERSTLPQPFCLTC